MLGVFELEKGRDIGVLLCSVCVEHETTHVGWPPCSPSMNTHTNVVFSCSAYVGLPVWVEDGGGCGGGQLIVGVGKPTKICVPVKVAVTGFGNTFDPVPTRYPCRL